MTSLKVKFLDEELIERFAPLGIENSEDAAVVLFIGAPSDWHETYHSEFSMRYNNKDCFFIDVEREGTGKTVELIKNYYAAKERKKVS